MDNDHKEIVEISDKQNDKNSTTDLKNDEDWEDLLIKIDKLDIKDERNIEDKETPQEDVASNKPKEKIRIGRGFKEQSHSVLKNEPVDNRLQRNTKHEPTPPKTELKSEKTNVDNEKTSQIDSSQKKRSQLGKPGERNIAVASRMLRNALGFKGPPTEKEKQHEQRLKELREEKQKQSDNETSKSQDDITKNT